MPEAVLNVLVGEGTGQTLEDIEVEFPAPAVDIEVPDKQVEVTRCEVIPGKVIVVGRVIKSICFLHENGTFSPRIPLKITCRGSHTEIFFTADYTDDADGENRCVS